MEDRMLLATMTWGGGSSSLWSDPANWKEGIVPGASDTAVFDNTASQFACTLDGAAPASIGNVVVDWDQPNASLTLGRAATFGNLTMTEGEILGAFELTIGGGIWTSGAIRTSKLIVSAAATFEITGDGMKTIGATFENFGTTRWIGGDVLTAASTTIINNKPGGIFEANNHASWLQESNNVGFFNEGAFRKIGDTGATTFDIAFYGLKTASADIQVGTLRVTDNGKHVGPISIAAGASILCENGYLLDGVTISGDGYFHISGEEPVLVANGVRIDNLRMDSGELGYLGAVFIYETFLWNGGDLVGKTEMHAGSTMIIAGDAPKAIKYGAPVNNLGTTIWQDSSPIDVGGVWTNFPRSTFEVQGGGMMYSLGSGSFVNKGILRKTGGDATVMQTQFTNTGRIEVESGSIQLYRGTSSPGKNVLTIAAGASLDLVDFTLDSTVVEGDGPLRFVGAGTVTIKGDVTAANVEQTDGLLNLNEGNLIITDHMTWLKGFMTGGTQNRLEIQPQASFEIAGPSGRVLSANVVAFGNSTWSGTGVVTITNGRSITNKPGAVFEATGSSAMTSAGTFRNEGTLKKINPQGLPTRFDVTLVNTGVIEVQSGTISLGKAFSNAGSLVIGAGAGFSTDQSYTQTAGGSVTLQNGSLSAKTGLTINAGTLSGTGTITGNLQSNGTIAPGGASAVGILQVVGGFTQFGSGVLQIDIAELDAGTGYDRLAVSGAAILGGTLSVTLLNGFAPQGGTAFAVVTYASQTGTFTTLSGDASLFDPDYGPSDFELIAKSTRGLQRNLIASRMSSRVQRWTDRFAR
jgi:hypothetical protein